MSEVLTPAPSDAEDAFQARVDKWLIACFGEEIARDKVERNHRFLEESLELVQAGGCTASEAHQLVDYTFARPVGEIGQEVGGVMNTLAALCLAYDRDMLADGEVEIARCWTKVDVIRAKQAAKPKHSPLPIAAPSDALRLAVEKATVLLWSFIVYGCPVCGGDCSAANPPMAYCPMNEARQMADELDAALKLPERG